MLTMLTQLFRNWWQFAVRGVLAIVFGIVALIWPEPTKVALVLLFAVFALLDGLFTAATGIEAYGAFRQWWALLLEGLTGIVIAVLAFIWPNTAGNILLYVIGAWAVLTGVFEILAAIELRNVIEGESLMILHGVLMVTVGILLFLFPAAGAMGLVWAIGIYAITVGIMEMIFAFRLRGLLHKFETIGAISA